jgi:hypothetical protein
MGLKITILCEEIREEQIKTIGMKNNVIAP